MASSQVNAPWTGAKSGQRYNEYQQANQYGLTYTPGQAAGTAQKQYEALTAGQPKSDNTVAGQMITYGPNGEIYSDLSRTRRLDTPQGAEGGALGAAYDINNDPYYQNALAAGQSEFNLARNQAMADLQNQQTGAESNLRSLDKNATESRRRLAGNYAARGMAGGAAGALTLAEARANAEQIASQTSIKDQIAALNQNYLSTYGATGTDWTGTLLGQKYKTAAVQQALQARLGQMGI